MLLTAFSDFLSRLRRLFQSPKRVVPSRPCGERLEDRVLLSIDAVQVADIFPGATGSTPKNLTDVNGTIFFTADDGVHDEELWKSDGTAAGTMLVKDIGPQFNSSFTSQLTNVNGTLFFSASDFVHGGELWKSDGTEAGTVMVKDINPSTTPGSKGSYPAYLTNLNGTLFFSANDGTNGIELWKSDGTDAGTAMLKDINPGSADGNPFHTVVLNNTLYFSANDGTTGFELWKSNGTANGTVEVKDIFTGSDATYPGPNSAYPDNLTNVNGTLYFTATEAQSDYELWKSDGTSAGTVLIKDIQATGSDYVTNLTNVNGTLYFTASATSTYDSELWKSNGTSAGTVLLKNFGDHGYGSVSDLIDFNGTLFFSGTDQSSSAELWKSNGTAGGTQLVKNLYPGATDSYLSDLTNFNGTMYFVSDSAAEGAELWQSDGTASGTAIVKDIIPGDIGSYPNYLTIVHGVLYFTAATDAAGEELWRLTDGNVAPTDIALSATSIAENNAPNATVGSLSATDSNSGESFTYSLVSGAGSTDNASFSISGNSLKLIPVANFATQSSYAIRLQVTDHGGLSFEKTFTITVTQVDPTDPRLTLDSSKLTFHVSGRKAVKLDGSATIKTGNGSALNFDGAILQVSGYTSKDTISILKQDGFAAKGKKVVSGKTVIGTLSGGKKGVALSIQFNAAATPDLVDGILKHISFKSTDKVAGTRSIQVQIKNIGGKNSNQATRDVDVQQ